MLLYNLCFTFHFMIYVSFHDMNFIHERDLLGMRVYHHDTLAPQGRCTQHIVPTGTVNTHRRDHRLNHPSITPQI